MRSGKASNIPGDAPGPYPLQILQEALAIAKFEPGIYEVVQTFAPSVIRKRRRFKTASPREDERGEAKEARDQFGTT
jgi:hypothetical protein